MFVVGLLHQDLILDHIPEFTVGELSYELLVATLRAGTFLSQLRIEQKAKRRVWRDLTPIVH
jgi:hypothetical protein